MSPAPPYISTPESLGSYECGTEITAAVQRSGEIFQAKIGLITEGMLTVNGKCIRTKGGTLEHYPEHLMNIFSSLLAEKN